MFYIHIFPVEYVGNSTGGRFKVIENTRRGRGSGSEPSKFQGRGQFLVKFQGQRLYFAWKTEGGFGIKFQEAELFYLKISWGDIFG